MRVLEVEGRFDGSKIASGFDEVGSSAGSMASAVDRAATKVDGAASRLDRTADAADNLDSKSAQATGSLGALSSGFELVGAEKYAGTLQSAAMATDFLAGVGEGLNLITQLSIVAKARDALASLRVAAATRIQAAGARAAALGTRILNAAMRANPIGLVITAAVILGGLFVLLYKRSDRFRAIVQAVGRAGRSALGWVVDKSRELVNWVGSRIPGGFKTVKSAATLYFRLATLPIRTVIDVVGNLIKRVGDVPAKFTALKNKAQEIGSALLSPFQSVLNVINDIIDRISKIRLPKIDLNPLNRVGARYGDYGPGPGAPGAYGGGGSLTVNIGGVVDERTARQLRTTLVNIDRRNGR
jgi:hypothetical protein